MPLIGVTGATGTVGRHVCRALAGAGARVRALARHPLTGVTDGDRCEFQPFDWDDRATWPAALAGVGRLFVLMPLRPELPRLSADLAEAIEQARAPRTNDAGPRDAGPDYLVKLSAYGVGNHPSLLLGELHGAAEAALSAAGALTALRPNGFMDNFAVHLAPAVRQGRFDVAQGEGKVSVISARDIGAVAASLLLEPRHIGESLVLTGPAALDNHTMAHTFSQVLGHDVEYRASDPVETRKAMEAMGMPGWLVQVLSELDALVRDDGAAAVTGDVQRVTGRAAESFEAWVRANTERFG